ncbi:MAG: VCBS repeat-containing protein, partial [candidate division Zixibacteria bacterium]|nr:VCBS repeat-containing protein [candidate division Zixibacteria bacterium]
MAHTLGADEYTDIFVATRAFHYLPNVFLQGEGGMRYLTMFVCLLALIAMFYPFSSVHAELIFTYRIDCPVGSRPRALYAADYDGNGWIDLATANSNSNTVSILLNNGNGSFQSAVDYPSDIMPHGLFSADYDRDGDMDLAIANGNSNSVSILFNTGDGTFVQGGTYEVGQTPLGITGGDFDGDGDVDLVTANDDADNISFLRNNGDGTFGGAVN